MPINGAEKLESQPENREAARAIEQEYARELKQLSDHAFMFLNAMDGSSADSEELLDTFIGLLFDGSVSSMWRYRIILQAIREGACERKTSAKFHASAERHF